MVEVLRARVWCSVLIPAVTAIAAVAAARPPEPVSPGSTDLMGRVGDPCPTFSWTQAPGAKGYELNVYAVGETDESVEVLHQKIPGGAGTWTPSLTSCLERGGRYAWVVRSLGGKGTSAWSAPSLFEIPDGPSTAELEAALEVVRRHLETNEAPPPAASDPGKPGREVAARVAAVELVRGEMPEALAPPAETQLTVDGNVDATSFTGSGEHLTGIPTESEVAALVAAERECPGSVGSGDRFTNCNNGTARDNATGLFWLRNASCNGLAGADVEGRADWDTAVSAAGALEPPFCGLTDGSQAGDWRLATAAEFCSAWSGIFLSPCPDTAATDSLLDSSEDEPKLVKPNPFFGVLLERYWTGTEDGEASAWYVDPRYANVLTNPKTFVNGTWPVREGL